MRDNGNRTSYLLRRLERDHPELFARVQAGELSAHKAAIEAGWRPRQITVNASSLDKLEATLRRHVAPDVLADLAQRLSA